MYNQQNVFLRMEARDYTELYNAFNNNIPLDYPNFISLAKSNQSSFIDGGKWLNVIFEINPNHGFKQIDMQPFSRAEDTPIGSELEVLVIRGKKMRITNIENKPFPSENDLDLEGWLTNDMLHQNGYTDIEGNILSVNPNAISTNDFYSNNYTPEQYENASKILTVTINIVNQ